MTPTPVPLSPLAIVLTFAALSSVSTSQQITVAVAANARYPFEEIQQSFERETHNRLRSVISSSGNITNQILNGAPFDVFLSADTSYPGALFRAGYAVNAPVIYAYGRLVVWISNGVADSSLECLRSGRIRRVALAEPSTAPYGREAERALTASGLINALRSRLVYGTSISQVNQYILTGSVDAALTGQSLMFEPSVAPPGSWTPVAASMYEPIAQGIVVIRQSDSIRVSRAKQFAEFVLSPASRDILRRYGYTLP